MTTAPTLQRLPEVLGARGVKRAKHYLDIEKGLWTKPVNIGPSFSAWPAHETEALIAARIAGADDEKVRELVHQLHERRLSAFAEVQSRYLNRSAAVGAT